MPAAATSPRFPPGWRSLTEHGSDPQNLHRAARALGIMLGDARIDDATAYECVRLWASDAGVEHSGGLRSRLCHAVNDSADARRIEVEGARRAAVSVGRDLIPQGAPADAIIRIAKAAADKVCCAALGEDEIRSILRDEWDRLRIAARYRR